MTLRRRPAAEVETAAEPECTPRSTGSSPLVSAAVGSESSSASHAILAIRYHHLLHFLGKKKMALPLEIGMNSLSWLQAFVGGQTV